MSLRPGRQAEEQPQRGRRVDRRPDRQGPAVLLRVGLAALRPPHQRLRLLERHRAGLDRSEARPINQAFGKVTYSTGRVQANASVLLHADPRRRHAVGLQRHRPAIRRQLAGRQSAQRRSRVQAGSDQRRAATSTIFLTQLVVGQRARRLLPRQLRRTPAFPTTTSVIWNNAVRSAMRRRSREPAAAESGAHNTPRAQITDFDTTKRGFFHVDYNHAFNAGGSHLAEGRRRVPESHQRRRLGLPRRLRAAQLERARSRAAAGRWAAPAPTATTKSTTAARSAPRARTSTRSTSRTRGRVGNRLTLNLGVRTENETIPSFRPDIKENAFEFGFGEKLAPRLGATYDVLGDGRVKVYRQLGPLLRLDEVRAGARLVRRRHLARLLPVARHARRQQPEPEQHAGPRSVAADVAGSLRDRRVPNFDAIDPDIKPMFQDSTNVGLEYQLNPTTVFGVNYVHNNLTRTIEDVGALVDGNEIYLIGNPGEGARRALRRRHRADRAVRDAEAAAPVRRARAHASAAASPTTGSAAPATPSAASTATTPAWPTPTRSRRRRPGRRQRTAQQQAGSIARAGRQRQPRVGPRRAPVGLARQPRRARPSGHRPSAVVKLYGAYQLPFGTQVGGFVYAGSGTPMSTVVNTTNRSRCS